MIFHWKMINTKLAERERERQHKNKFQFIYRKFYVPLDVIGKSVCMLSPREKSECVCECVCVSVSVCLC